MSFDLPLGVIIPQSTFFSTLKSTGFNIQEPGNDGCWCLPPGTLRGMYLLSAYSWTDKPLLRLARYGH